jgi:predicted heme/steroid binding protein
MLQHDIRHSGLSPYSNNATGTPTSTPKWIANLGTGGPTSPIIGFDGEIYIGASSGKLYKVSFSSTTTVELFYDTQNGTVQTPVLASDGTIYLIDNHYLYALTSDGRLKWKYSIGDGSEGPSAPAIGSDGTVYIASDSYLYALTPNGEKIWQSPELSNGRWVRSPIIDSNGR